MLQNKEYINSKIESILNAHKTSLPQDVTMLKKELTTFITSELYVARVNTANHIKNVMSSFQSDLNSTIIPEYLAKNHE